MVVRTVRHFIPYWSENVGSPMRCLPLIVVLVVGLAAPANSQQSYDLKTDLEVLADLAERSMPDRAARWRCRIETQHVCAAEGCKPVKPTVWLDIDFPSQSYQRCDARGCDTYSVIHSVGGIYTTISRIGTFVKALNDGSEFVEVATLGTSVWNGFGECVPK